MADAVQTLITELLEYRRSNKAEPVQATINNMVAAFEEIEGDLIPGGNTPQNANTVLSGPATGVAALPTFRTLVAADLEQFNVAAGNRVFASPSGVAGAPSFRALVATDIPSLAAIYLPLAGGTMTDTEQFADGSQFSAAGLAMAATRTITPDQLAGIVGTTTNNSANAGSVGEFIESVVTGAAPAPIANNTTTNLTSIALTAGDWDVESMVGFVPTASITSILFGPNTVSLTFPAIERFGELNFTGGIGSRQSFSVARQRFSLAGPETVYAVAEVTLSAGTCNMYGYLNARRVR